MILVAAGGTNVGSSPNVGSVPATVKNTHGVFNRTKEVAINIAIARLEAWKARQHRRSLKEVLAAVLDRALRYRLDAQLYRVVWTMRLAADGDG